VLIHVTEQLVGNLNGYLRHIQVLIRPECNIILVADDT
jgi:hypothetical protein